MIYALWLKYLWMLFMIPVFPPSKTCFIRETNVQKKRFDLKLNDKKSIMNLSLAGIIYKPRFVMLLPLYGQKCWKKWSKIASRYKITLEPAVAVMIQKSYLNYILKNIFWIKSILCQFEKCILILLFVKVRYLKSILNLRVYFLTKKLLFTLPDTFTWYMRRVAEKRARTPRQLRVWEFLKKLEGVWSADYTISCL